MLYSMKIKISDHVHTYIHSIMYICTCLEIFKDAFNYYYLCVRACVCMRCACVCVCYTYVCACTMCVCAVCERVRTPVFIHSAVHYMLLLVAYHVL